MRILALHLRNFRGFDDFVLKPQGHVVLMGEPRAGRSDLIEGLRRVLHPDSNRFPLSGVSTTSLGTTARPPNDGGGPRRYSIGRFLGGFLNW